MGSVAEALLQLPEVPFGRADAAAAAGVPAGLWLTVGLLAADGFALQLRLRKAEKVGGSENISNDYWRCGGCGSCVSALSGRVNQILLL